MIKNYNYPGWTKRVALSAAALCVAATAAQAQTTSYGTGFDGTDTVNGSSSAATYASPNAPTDPLDGQNGWASNDGTVTTGTSGTSTQLVGRSDYVGSTGFYTGQTGALGGIYRTTTPTAAAPDVVPSSNATGGIVNLYHPVTIGTGASFIALNVDFAVTSPVNFASRDTFGFSLQSTAFASLISINFQPSTSSPTTQDAISYTVGGVTTTTGSSIVLNGTYHLALTVSPAGKSFTATITSGSNSLTFNGSLATAAINAAAVGEVVTQWNLANKTLTSGAYQGAGDNTLVFDNLAVTVPEPSTYALMALGLVGLVGVARARRQQA